MSIPIHILKKSKATSIYINVFYLQLVCISPLLVDRGLKSSLHKVPLSEHGWRWWWSCNNLGSNRESDQLECTTLNHFLLNPMRNTRPILQSYLCTWHPWSRSLDSAPASSSCAYSSPWQDWDTTDPYSATEIRGCLPLYFQIIKLLLFHVPTKWRGDWYLVCFDCAVVTSIVW